MLAAQYTQQLKTNVSAFASVEWRYLGKQYFDLANNLKQNPYHLLNARLGLAVKKVQLALWAENLTDRTYVDYAYNFGAAHLGVPRTYGILLRTNF